VINVVTTRQKDIPDESFTIKTEIIINLNTTKIATPDNLKPLIYQKNLKPSDQIIVKRRVLTQFISKN
jgi:hypothetical protein